MSRKAVSLYVSSLRLKAQPFARNENPACGAAQPLRTAKRPQPPRLFIALNTYVGLC
jgi:hypothetical protein